MLKIGKDKCISCGICSTICPVGAIIEKEDGTFEINLDECMECFSCMNTCTQDAITDEDE